MSLIKAVQPNSFGGDENNVLIHGLETGIVTDISDPQNMGEVKVKLINRDTSEYETDFVPTMTVLTGEDFGAFCHPKVGDEVVLGFFHGDIRQPCVLGYKRNTTRKPPAEISNQEGKIKILKTEDGNCLTILDDKDKDNIRILTPKGLTIEMDDDKEIVIIKDKSGDNMMKLDSKNNIITIQASKKILLQSGNATIEIDGDGNKISIESGQSIRLKSQQIDIEASSILNLKASSNMKIKCDGPVGIEGAVINNK